GSTNHFEAIRRSIVGAIHELPLLGYLPNDAKITIPQRHLGLITSHEDKVSTEAYHNIGNLLATTVNLDKILEIANAV
ncbi:MAG: hypothetical protein ACUZ77_11320, partial [Candidatus Brocadiales bacterium]